MSDAGASSTFRFDAAQAFLTYPQAATLTKEIIAEFFNDAYPDCTWIIAQEKHEDGQPHFHVYIKFGKKVSSRNARVFDINGFHPNIAPKVRSPKKVYEYCAKDGDFIVKGMDPPKENCWAKALKRARDDKDSDGAFKMLCESSPKDILLRGEQIKRNLLIINPMMNPFVSEAIIEPGEYIEHPVMDQWFVTHVWDPKPGRKPCLFVIGDTGLGKTSWLRSKGKHLFMRSLFALANWTQDIEYVIFDDIDWTTFAPWGKRAILNSQGLMAGTGKYMPVAHIRSDKPCIWISNTIPKWENEDEKYWNDPINGTWVFIDQKLYK